MKISLDWLSDFVDLSGIAPETIADRLGGSPETARANVYQGLKRLRCQLSEVWQEERSV